MGLLLTKAYCFFAGYIVIIPVRGTGAFVFNANRMVEKKGFIYNPLH
jgi:hypothetical protein